MKRSLRTSGRRPGRIRLSRPWAARLSAASAPMKRCVRLSARAAVLRKRRQPCSRLGSPMPNICRAASRSWKRCSPLIERPWPRRRRAAGTISALRPGSGSSPCCAARNTMRCARRSLRSASRLRRTATRPRRSSRMPGTATWRRPRRMYWGTSERAARRCGAMQT